MSHAVLEGLLLKHAAQQWVARTARQRRPAGVQWPGPSRPSECSETTPAANAGDAAVMLPRIESRILVVRNQKAIIDSDLALLYGVPTKALNQAVKRNAERFPMDFMFQLSVPEKAEVVTSCDHLSSRT